ncbi:MAG: hypothetical protein ACOCZ8_04290 [Bacteroidota bacterium]
MKKLLNLLIACLLPIFALAQGSVEASGGLAATIPVGISNTELTPGIGIDAGLHYRNSDRTLSFGANTGFYRFWPDSTAAFDVSYVPIVGELNYYFGEAGATMLYVGARGGIVRYFERTRNPSIVLQDETRSYWYGTFSPQFGIEVPLISQLALDIRLAYNVVLTKESSSDANLQHFTVGAGVRYRLGG